MNSQKRNVCMMLSLLVLLLSMSVGCATVPKEPRYINVKPQVAPLSASVSQAIQPNSTSLLKRAELWLKNSGELLDSVTDSSPK